MRRLLLAPGLILLAASLVVGCKPSTSTSPTGPPPAPQPPAPQPPVLPPAHTGTQPVTPELGKPATELKAISVFPIHKKLRVFDMALSPDGHIAVAPDDKEDGPHLWDTATGKVIPWQDADTAKYMKLSVTGPIFSSDGNRLWTVGSVPLGLGDSAIIGINTKSHKIEESIPAPQSSSYCLALSPDENLLATNWAVYDLKNKKPKFEFGKEQKIQKQIGFGPNGKTLAGRSDPAITIWNVETGMITHTLPFEVPFHSSGTYLAVSPKSDLFALRRGTGKEGVVEIRDSATGEVKHTFCKGFNLKEGCLTWSPDGKYLTVAVELGRFEEALRRTIWLLDATTGKPVASFAPAFEHDVDAISFSGDSSRLAIITSSEEPDRKIPAELFVWDLTKLAK